MARGRTPGDREFCEELFVVTRGPVARLLRGREPALQEAALRIVTERFAARVGTGRIALGAACWLVSAQT